MPQLRPKQLEVVTDLRERFIHADPPGTGKTPVGWRWVQAHGADRVLIVAPRNVLRHWEALGHIWAPEYTITVIPTKTPAKKRRFYIDAMDDVTGPEALIIPYSVLREDVDLLLTKGFEAIIADEAHKLKDRTTQVFKAAAKLAWRAPVIDLTTASPILNRADEAWSAMHLIDRKRWPSFWRWAREHFYCTMSNFGGRSVRAVEQVGDPRPGALEAIRDEFGPLLVMRSEAELEMDLPDVVSIPLMVDLSPAERRIYDQMSKHFWLKEGGTTVFASNEVSKITRLRQLSSDWSDMLDNEVVDDGTKVQAAADLIIDELQGKSVVVFAQFKGTVRRLVARLRKAGVSATAYTGDEDDDARESALEAFLYREVQVLVGTDSTMAEGLDGLQAVAHHMVIIDPDWVPEIVNQKIGRLKRDGQLSPTVFVYYILARDTIDQTVELAREAKESVIDVVVGHALKDVVSGTMTEASSAVYT